VAEATQAGVAHLKETPQVRRAFTARAQALLEHGRLRLDQLLDAVAAKAGVQPVGLREQLHARFISLVNGRFVERAVPCNLPPYKQPPPPKAQVSVPCVPHLVPKSRSNGQAVYRHDCALMPQSVQ
jgi:hypothetical protein